MSIEADPRVAVIGTGVIGAGWVTLLLSRGWQVEAFDPAFESAEPLIEAIRKSWPAMAALGSPPDPPLNLLRWHPELEGAVADVVFVQESGPEQLDTKRDLITQIDSCTSSSVVIASSSSGLKPSQVACGAHRNPERVLVGHPFHPTHLIPLVEVVPADVTSEQAVATAMNLYTQMGKRPIRVRHELEGHLANRLQAALWREAYDLVERGAATVADIDTVITNGPGLRWALVGPFAAQHLSGGAAGIQHTLSHLGPPMVDWWNDMQTPSLTEELINSITTQVAEEMGDVTVDALSRARDQLLIDLLASKRAHEGLTT